MSSKGLVPFCVVEPRPAESWGLFQLKTFENGLAQKVVSFLSGEVFKKRPDEFVARML